MNNQLELSYKNAKKLLNANIGIKLNEKVLIITDDKVPFIISEILANTAKKIAKQVSIIITYDNIMNLNDFIKATIEQADVIIAPTSATIGHSAEIAKALKRGCRVATLTGFKEDSLTSEAFETNFKGILPIVKKIVQIFNQANKIHVTTIEGTDLNMDLTGRKAKFCSGICRKPGEMMALPDIEVYIAPNEEKTNGKLVIDASCSFIGKIENKIYLNIKNGKVTDIDGKIEAKKLNKILSDTNFPSSYVVAEFAIGLNPRGKISGTISIDEGIYGTAHIALGKNDTFGGKNFAPIHLDMVFKNPTIIIDNKTFMRDGQLTINGFDEKLRRC